MQNISKYIIIVNIFFSYSSANKHLSQSSSPPVEGNNPRVVWLMFIP